MERIICIEQPFHESVDFGVSSALSVIQKQQRYRERDAELYQSVYFIDSEEIYNCIDCSPGIDQAICFFGSPLFVPMDSTLSDAMQLQSAGSATAQISKVKITFAGILILLLSAIRSRTSPHASDHMTLVLVEDVPIIKRNK